MKKIYIIIISLSVCLTICGQTISQPNNRYRGNDVLEKKQVKVQGFDLNSKKGVWNLEEAELSEESYDAEYSTETDTLMAVERGSRTYFREARDSMDIIGTENYMELMSYDIGNSNRRQIDSYLVTPNGSLQKYDPKKNIISIISNDMPSDPNDPDSLNSNYVESDNFSINDFLNMLRIETYTKE